jgi:hypothetical protein
VLPQLLVLPEPNTPTPTPHASVWVVGALDTSVVELTPLAVLGSWEV